MVSTRMNRALVPIDTTTSHSQLVVNNRVLVPIYTGTSYSDQLPVNNRQQNVRYGIFIIVFIKNIFESMAFNAHN